MDNLVTPCCFRDLPGVLPAGGLGLGFPRLELNPEFPVFPEIFLATPVIVTLLTFGYTFSSKAFISEHLVYHLVFQLILVFLVGYKHKDILCSIVHTG